MEVAHEEAKKDPEKYLKWVGRDYSMMGTLGGISSHSPRGEALRRKAMRMKKGIKFAGNPI